MDRDFAWQTLIDGYTGTAHARRFATRIFDGPVVGYRFSGGEERPTEPFDDFFAKGEDLPAAIETVPSRTAAVRRDALVTPARQTT
jgi:hypothetical protein